MAYPNTGSILTEAGGKNTTRTALSTNIIIKVEEVAVGAAQTLQIQESRGIAMIDEIGTDGHIDSAPNKSTDISGSCERIRFDGMRIMTAFKNGYLHAHAQRRPFDIDIYDYWQDVNNPTITTIKNVWTQSISTNYQASNFVISDSMQWMAETIYTKLNGKSAASSGQRGFALNASTVEISADTGGRRGALDAADLLHAFQEI